MGKGGVNKSKVQQAARGSDVPVPIIHFSKVKTGREGFSGFQKHILTFKMQAVFTSICIFSLSPPLVLLNAIISALQSCHCRFHQQISSFRVPCLYIRMHKITQISTSLRAPILRWGLRSIPCLFQTSYFNNRIRLQSCQYYWPRACQVLNSVMNYQ